MATTKESSTENHFTIGHNNGQLIAGNHNIINSYNVYTNLKIESPRNDNKKRSNKRKRIKKKLRQENSDRGEGSKNSEHQEKGKKSGKNSPRKVSFLNDFSGHPFEESNDNGGLKTSRNANEQEFITTSEGSEDEFPNQASLLATDAAEKASILRYRLNIKENSSSKENLVGFSESESESYDRAAKNNNESGGLFSPFKVALRQAVCFTVCMMFCVYFEALPYLPLLFWLIFVANNLLACFSCIKLTFKRIDCQDMPPQNMERSFIAIARLQIDFFIKEENILQRLFALLLCVSLAFVSSQIFGCATCLWMQTIVITTVSTIPYLLFKNNILLTSALSQHCRVFKAGLESSGNPLC